MSISGVAYMWLIRKDDNNSLLEFGEFCRVMTAGENSTKHRTSKMRLRTLRVRFDARQCVIAEIL